MVSRRPSTTGRRSCCAPRSSRQGRTRVRRSSSSTICARSSTSNWSSPARARGCGRSEKRRPRRSPGLLQELQTLDPGTAVVSIGDYNAYQFSDGYTDPIATLKGTPTPDDQIVVDESPDLVKPDYVNLTDSCRPTSGTASSSRGPRRRWTTCSSTQWANRRGRRYADRPEQRRLPEASLSRGI